MGIGIMINSVLVIVGILCGIFLETFFVEMTSIVVTLTMLILILPKGSGSPSGQPRMDHVASVLVCWIAILVPMWITWAVKSLLIKLQ